MYFTHFGLAATPFSSQPIAANYVATPGHDEALARLEFLVQSQACGGLLSGCSGSGKTLLLEVLARGQRRRGAMVALVSAAQADTTETLFAIANQWGVSLPALLPASRLVRLVADRLAELRYDQTAAVLLVDDVDRASGERLAALEEVLASFNQPLPPTTIVAASPEALERLPTSLSRRADLRVELLPWDEADIRQFLSHRLAKAGCPATLFDDGAVAALCEASAGNPRHVSQLAHLGLVAAAGKDLPVVDAETMEEVCRELSVGVY